MNLLLISIDTIRSDHMGIYGYPVNTTPYIDSIAQNSLVFSNAFTMTPFTYPSIAGLMTAKSPFNTNIITNGLGPLIDDKTPTLTKILKNKGYKTAAFVTNRFIGPNLSNLNDGFDEFYFHDSYGNWKLNTTRRLYNDFIDKAVSYIQRNKHKKQFVWVHLMDPHFPYYPPDDFKCISGKNYCEEILKMSIEDISNRISENYGCSKLNTSENTMSIYKSLYDGDIRQADNLIGQIIKGLREADLFDKTVIVIFGDHGEGFDHNYNFTHGAVLYNTSLKIPLIIKSPSFNSGKIIHQDVLNIDVLPSLLDLLDIDKNQYYFDGKSFINFIQTDTGIGKINSFFINNTGTKFAVKNENYKYIFSLEKSCKYKNQLEELYDLKTDPQENINIANSKKEIALNLKKQLIYFLNKHGYPRKNPVSEGEMNKDIILKLKQMGY